MEEEYRKMDEIIKNFFEGMDEKGIVYDDPVTVPYDVIDRYVTISNVPHITYDDPLDSRWYCLPYESEKVLVAYLKHPLIRAIEEPFVVDYNDVVGFLRGVGKIE